MQKSPISSKKGAIFDSCTLKIHHWGEDDLNCFTNSAGVMPVTL